MSDDDGSSTHEETTHVAKRPKTAAASSDDVLSKATETAWEHFRNFLDSVSEDDVGDLDELQELVQVLKPHMSSTRMQSASSYNSSVSDIVQHYRSTRTLLPVLVSVAHYHLADAAIVESVDSSDDNNTSLHAEAMEHLNKSVEWFALNAATWSVGANYGRMTKRLAPSVICRCYQQAAASAAKLRTAALELLEGENAVSDDMVKEWIELLFLDSIVDAEYVVQDENEEEEDGTKYINENGQQQQDEEEPDGGYFSASRNEAISRFMASMLLSTAGKHDEAMKQLQRFDLTHRLHPNVWSGASTADGGAAVNHHNGVDKNDRVAVKEEPVVYPQNALPPRLYQRLCQVFSPNASYWKESDYAHRGYFSYFMDVPSFQKDWRPSNLMEDVIWCHLLPLVKKSMANNDDCSKIVGAEWWVHTRPIQANLGHNLHFDTDEALLAQQKQITHPIRSSVLYLTGNEDSSFSVQKSSPAGATIILNQTPDSDCAADFCWTSRPRDNTYMIFPGNLLHGVLPCPGDTSTNDESTSNDNNIKKSSDELVSFPFRNSPNDKQDNNNKHRLTFMVGFWTRRVPDKMKERKLYGPCGPMPLPAASKHSWASEIAQGYCNNNNGNSLSDYSECNDVVVGSPVSLPKVYPAWEEIKHKQAASSPNKGEMEEPLLQLPATAQRIDHRFFVKDAPRCFRDMLFEDNEGDE